AEGSRDQIMWSANGQSVAIGGHWIELQDIRKMMKDSIASMETGLKSLLAHANDQSFLAAFDLSKLVDNPSQDDPNMWFGNLASNEAHLNLDAYGDQVMPTLMTMEMDNKTKKWQPNPDWNKVQLLWDEEAKFLKALLVAIHITSGMPSRGSELLETTWRNDYGARLRNVLAGHDGEIMLDSTYSKTEYKSTRVKQNIRFLHPSVARVLAIYLCTVRQTTDELFHIKYDVSRTYLWCNVNDMCQRGIARWDTTYLGRALKTQSELSGVGAALNVSEFRQLIEAVAHKHFRTGYLREAMRVLFPADPNRQDACEDLDDPTLLGLEGCGEEEEDFLDIAADFMDGLRGGGSPQRGQQQDLFSAQSGRSDEASWACYARQKTHRAGMDDGVITNSRVASRMYQAFFGLFPPRVSGKTPSTTATSHQGVPVGPSESQPVELSSRMRGDFVPAGHMAKTPASDQKASIPLAADVRTRTAMLATGPSSFAGSADSLQSRLALSPLVLRAVMDLTKGSYPRRPLALPVSDGLALIERSIANFACIVKTNGGKSLLWQADAWISRKDVPSFALLVVPYLSLIDDIKRVGREQGIACADWSPSLTISPNTEIVIVSLAKAVKGEFLQWLGDPEIQAALRRVFVDEAHVLIDDTFRKGIEDFGKLTERLAARQFVFLSATIPPACEERLEKIICMPLLFLREGTNRNNLAYSLIDVDKERNAVDHVRSNIQRVTTGVNAGRQGLVICRDKRTVKRVARELGCGYYFSNNDASEGEIQEMDDAMEEFKTGLTPVLVGTNAASTGIDFDRVDLVALIDGVYSMAAGMQAAGRAGRRGARAEVFIYKLKESRYPTKNLPEGPHPRTDEEAVGLLLAGERCMREPISHWLDGRVVSCLELGGEWCSVCEEMYDKPVSPSASTPMFAVGREKRRLLERATEPQANKRRALDTPTRTLESSDHVFSNISSPSSNESTLVRRYRPVTSTSRTEHGWNSEPSSSGSSTASGDVWDSPSAKKGYSTGDRLTPMTASCSSTPVNIRKTCGPSTAHNASSSYSHKTAFTTWAVLKDQFVRYLDLTKNACAMCYMVQRDFRHKASHCTLKDCNMAAQKAFREKGRNDWPRGQVCWCCSLPVSICNGRLNGGNCELNAYRDMIRGILLLLTLHDGVRAETVKRAQGIDGDYELPRPKAPGVMGEAWMVPCLLRGTARVYQAFPAVMAVVSMLAKALE
ncbi:hypothetical protein A4X13_0g8438, partial [Tilletia indica]